MLSKSQLVDEIRERQETEFSRGEVRDILDAIAAIAADEIASGEDFQIPGVCKVYHRYTKPRKKGETYIGFGGEETKAEKARPAKLTLKANPLKAMKDVAPSLTTKGGKAVAARKG